MSRIGRILLLIPSMRAAGGTERVVQNLADLFSGMGHEVAIATFDEPGVQRHIDGVQQWFPLGPVAHRPLPLRIFEYLDEARRLSKLKAQFAPDLTISNLWRADLINQLSGGGDRKIAVAHINIVGNPTNRVMLRLRSFVGKIYRGFDRVVTVSPPLAGELTELYRLAPSQVAAINNFSDAPQATACLPDDGVLRFVWCGRLVPEKNLSGMLEVWAKAVASHTGVQLVVLGDGPLRSELETKAAALGLRTSTSALNREAQVVFAGVVERPADYIVSSCALLLSSLSEGMPMVLLEAIALGTPVIAADCPAGGVRAILGSESTQATGFGALVPIPLPGDDASQNAWLPWLENAFVDADERGRWRQAALLRAARFSSRTAAKAWQAVFDEIAA